MSERDINRWQETITPRDKAPQPWTIGSGGSWDMTEVQPIPDAMLAELAQRYQCAGTPWNCRSMPLSDSDREYMYLLYYSMQGLVARLRRAEAERDEFKRACFGHISDNSMLRAKIAAMENQEPVAYGTWDTQIGRSSRMMMVRLDNGQDGCRVPLYALPGAQAQPALDDEYGSTDFGYTFSGIELQDGDKRLMSMLVKAFGSDHPAVDDLTALLFRVPAQPAPVWPPLPSCGGPLCSDSEHHPLCRYSAPEAKP